MPEKSRQRGEVREGRRFCIAAVGRDAHGMDPRVKPEDNDGGEVGARVSPVGATTEP
jgi:hypothetical protein